MPLYSKAGAMRVMFLPVTMFVQRLPKQLRYGVAVLAIIFSVMDSALAIILVNAMSAVLAAVTLFFVVLFGILPELYVPPHAAALVAFCLAVVGSMGILVPWILCRFLPKEQGLCNCVESKAVSRMLMLIVAIVSACLVYYAMHASDD